jgi:tetratricopeptide (TPR) repeat protein
MWPFLVLYLKVIPNLRRSQISACLVVILLVTITVYLPGLNSRFILDDIYNLQGLGDINHHGLLYYIFGSGFAGAGGRPLSLLSFAIQHHDWPQNPYAFKLVNLIIHIFNSILLFIFSLQLSKRLIPVAQSQKIFSLLVAGLWLLHPIHVNTVLYAVQRMTEISACFSLLGMIGYVHGRNLIELGKIKKGIGWILVSVFVCTTLAVLGKENGILLPAFLIVIEMIVYRGRISPDLIRKGVWVILLLPIVCFALYVLINLENLQSSFNHRDFNPTERVITQFSVVINYLKIILFPHPNAFSFFHDGYPVSKSLLSTPFTFIAFSLVTAIIVISVILRKKYPVIAVGVGLFFIGHLLEAGPLSLELYFEHRNYFPSIGIMIFIAWIITSGIEVPRYKIPVGIFLGIYSLSIVAITADQASLWSEPEIQIIAWVNANPDSRRAKQELAMMYLESGQYNEAEKILDQLLIENLNDISLNIRHLHIRTCKKNENLSNSEFVSILNQAKNPLKYNLENIAILDYLVLDVIKNDCPKLAPILLEQIISTLILNPDSKINSAYLYEFMSSISIHRGNLGNALKHIQSSLSVQFDVERKLREIELLKMLERNGEREIAIRNLEEYLETNIKMYFAYHDIFINL